MIGFWLNMVYFDVNENATIALPGGKPKRPKTNHNIKLFLELKCLDQVRLARTKSSYKTGQGYFQQDLFILHE